MQWELAPAREAIARYWDEWDGINHATSNHVLLDSGFVEALVRYFAPPDAVLALCRAEGAEAAAVLRPVRKGFWETLAPGQSPLGLVVARNSSTIRSQMRTLLRQLPGYALGLSVLQQDLDQSSFRSLTEDAMIDRVEYQTTGRVILKGTFEDYWHGRGKDLVGNQARRRRRLVEAGHKVTLVEDRDPSVVADRIAEYGCLEESGWKGKDGTAVSMTNAQGAFYRDVFEHFCRNGEGTVYRLQLDGRTIASQLAVHRDEMLVFLKMTYDESFAKYAPGYLLREEILKTLFAQEKIKQVEFYGKVREGWTTKWTDEVHTMYHYNIYRHRWVAEAKKMAKKLRAVVG